MIFKNHDTVKRRLTVNMGEFATDINGTTVTQRPRSAPPWCIPTAVSS
jgi:hypothetical protein